MIGSNFLSIIRNLYSSPEDFILKVEKEIIDSRKYSDVITGYSFFQKLNNYIRYFKYITLCLAGEIKPEDWKYQSLWIRKEIPVKSKIIYESRSDSVNIIKDIFTECVKYILCINN